MKITRSNYIMVGVTSVASLTLAAAANQTLPDDLAKIITDATGVDVNDQVAGQGAHWDTTDEFNVYRLQRENLVRLDDPRVKVELDLDLIRDAPSVIDKRTFRQMQSDDYHPDFVYVRFKPGVDSGRSRAVHARLGATVAWESAIVPGLCMVQVSRSVPQVVNAYLDDNDVLYAEPHYRVESDDGVYNDPFQSLCWGLGTDTGASWACDAWFDQSSSGVIAIIDSGTNIGHADLAASIWSNPGEIPGNGVDDDGNGYVDDINGWNHYLDWLDDESTIDGVGGGFVGSCGEDHGTHTAGTVGARGNNGIGVIGVVPFAQLMILACNGPGECDPDGSGGLPFGSYPCCGLYFTVQALDYAIANGARVSNNSYGSYNFSQAAYDVIQAGQAAGHIVVASAGNDDNNNDVNPHYPDGYNLANIISVAAIDESGVRASFSNYGAQSVDIGAPGVDVYSTDGSFLQYGYKSGTSMAAPHVAGTVGLVQAMRPELQWHEVRALVLDSAEPSVFLIGQVSTGGMLRAFRGLGVWVDPTEFILVGFGSYVSPYGNLAFSTAYDRTPENGNLNIFPGVIGAGAEMDFDKPMTIRAPEGAATLGD